MKELLLIIALAGIFLFLYRVMRKTDVFFEKNRHPDGFERRESYNKICIAAESSGSLDRVVEVLEMLSEENAALKFTFLTGNRKRILKNLSEGDADLVLLTENPEEEFQDWYSVVELNGEGLFLVWNRQVKNANRDSVVFALENERFRPKNGYCDYKMVSAEVKN